MRTFYFSSLLFISFSVFGQTEDNDTLAAKQHTTPDNKILLQFHTQQTTIDDELPNVVVTQGMAFNMPVVKPPKNFDYRMPVCKPDSSIRYNMPIKRLQCDSIRNSPGIIIK